MSVKKQIKTIFSSLLAIAIVAAPLKTLDLNTSALTPEENNGLVYFEDDFDGYENGSEINGQNGWISVSRQLKNSHVIVDGALKTEDFAYNTSCNGVCTAITKRPEEESTLNQRLSVDILNMGEMVNTAFASPHLRVRPQQGANAEGEPNSSWSYYLDIRQGTVQIKYTTNGTTQKTIENAPQVSWTYTKDHIYRVEFTAEGVYPTKLTARIFDKTDSNRLLVEVEAEDSTPELQLSGTAALSCTRDGTGEKNHALFDNFKYEQTDKINYYDTFDGELDSGWKMGSKAVVTKNDGYINLKTDGAVDGSEYISASTVMHPEKALNQVVEIEFQRGTAVADSGAVVIARSQNGDGAFGTSYQASATVARGGATYYDGWVMLSNGQSTIINERCQWVGPNDRYRLQLSAISISETETRVTMALYQYETHNGIKIWRCRFIKSVIDTTEALQNPGAAGFSIKDKHCGSLNVYQFSHRTPADSFNTYELESETTIKNMYQKSEDSAACGGYVLAPVNSKNAAAYDKLTDSLNHNAPFAAISVNADQNKSYLFKLNYRMNWDNPVGGADPYAAVVVNGTTAYQFGFEGDYGAFAESREVRIDLNAGTNIIYFMAPTAEFVGATIDYDRLYMEEGIEITEVDVVSAGDINGDNAIDIKDLIRFKRYLANKENTQVNFNNIEALTGDTDENNWNADDIGKMCRYLLSMGTEESEFKTMSWFTFKAATKLNNTFYKLNTKKKLNVAYFGGSVTQGYSIESGYDANTSSWRALTTAWLKEQYPDAAITENNAAVGGTGTGFGMYRAIRDLKLEDTVQRPDLLFIEFGINDAYDDVGYDGAKRNLESIINTVYEYCPDTDIVILLTTDKTRADSLYPTIQAHIDVAKAYKLPYLHIGGMLWKEMCEETGGTYPSDAVWTKYFPVGDYVHPSKAGYAKYAGYVTDYLTELFGAIEEVPRASVNSYKLSETLTELPLNPYAAKLTGDVSGFYSIGDGSYHLCTNTVGNSFTVKFTGTEMKLWSWGFVFPATLSVEIDGGEAKSLELSRHAGNHKVFEVASGLENKEHTVKFTVTDIKVAGEGETDPQATSPKVQIRDFFISGSDDMSGVTLVK